MPALAARPCRAAGPAGTALHALPEAAGWAETLSIRHREQGLSSAHRNFLVLLQASEGPHWAA